MLIHSGHLYIYIFFSVSAINIKTISVALSFCFAVLNAIVAYSIVSLEINYDSTYRTAILYISM